MAKRGKTATKANMWVADFETTDSEELSPMNNNEIYKQRVWFAGLKNLETMKTTTFTTIDDFMNEALGRGNNQNKEIAFHNLKFDGSYIIPWLLQNGYFSTIERPKPKEFSVLVTDRNDWYSITVQVTKRRKVQFWDSSKLFPMKLEYLPTLYHTPTQKVEEDSEFYERKRGVNHVPTEQECHYLENDLQVLAETLNAHIDVVGLRFKKTQAGQAFDDFAKSFKAWKLRFPPLDTELDKEIRLSYWGGISYVPKHWASKTVDNVRVMDINSSYPHKAATCKLPYGECLFTWEDQHPDMSKFWIADVLIEFNLKPYCLPCIPSKAITENKPLDIDKWMTDSDGVVRIKLSSIDYQTIHESYDIKIKKWIKSWHFKQRVHPEVAKFVNTNNEIKVNGRKQAKTTTNDEERKTLLAKAQRAKINNNSFYGKFGEEVIKEGKTPYWDDELEGVTWEVDKIQELTDGKKKYLPVAIAITAYGRQQLVQLANALGKDFLYCDTDSVHYLQSGQYKVDELIERGDVKLDSTELGAWDVEGDFKKARYLRAKCYKEDDEATVAGLPSDPHTGQFSKVRSVLNWDNFYIGLNIPKSKANKLRSVRTETGTKLMPVDFTITKNTNMLYN